MYTTLILIVVFVVVVFIVFKKLKIAGISSSSSFEFETLEITIPKADVEVAVPSSMLAEHMFSSLHGLLQSDPSKQEHFSFEMVSDVHTIRFHTTVPKRISKFVESQIYAQYPTSNIRQVEDYIYDISEKGGPFEIATLKLSKESYFPIKTYKILEVDPMTALAASLGEIKAYEDLWLQFVIKPIADTWQAKGYDYINRIREGTKPVSFLTEIPSLIFNEIKEFLGVFIKQLFLGQHEEYDSKSSMKSQRIMLSAGQDAELRSIEEKLAKMGYEVTIKILSHAETKDRVESNMRSAIASLRQFSSATLNSFKVVGTSSTKEAFESFKRRDFEGSKTSILNVEELATMFHLPSGAVMTPGVSRIQSKKAEPPINLPTENCTFLGETLFRDKTVKFGIRNDGDDRVRHMYVVGKTGTGKSTLFKNMAIQDIQNGFGVGVVDPHGDLIEDILEYIPEDRLDDVVIIDPSDTSRPVGINVMELDDPSQKNLMASGLVSAMRKQFDYSWGPRLEYLLNNAILTLLEVPGTTMLSITRLLLDMNYQDFILHFVKDPVIMDFWQEEFKHMRGNQRLITEAVAPIQNKINRFLSSTTIRNILGQRTSTVDFADILNNKKILLINLSKGKIGADNANLLGALLVSRLQFYAMQRVNMPMSEREPFYLYVDEFQNFAGGNFEEILSESRKYRLALHLTHQFTSQIPEELLSAVFGNVGTIAAYGLGAPDARVLQTEFLPYFDENDLIGLEKFQMYIKLMIDGQTSRPFSAKIFRPWIAEESFTEKTGNRDRAVARSRELYGTDREALDARIRKWVGYPFNKGLAVAQEEKDKYNNKDKPDVTNSSNKDRGVK